MNPSATGGKACPPFRCSGGRRPVEKRSRKRPRNEPRSGHLHRSLVRPCADHGGSFLVPLAVAGIAVVSAWRKDSPVAVAFAFGPPAVTGVLPRGHPLGAPPSIPQNSNPHNSNHIRNSNPHKHIRNKHTWPLAFATNPDDPVEGLGPFLGEPPGQSRSRSAQTQRQTQTPGLLVAPPAPPAAPGLPPWLELLKHESESFSSREAASRRVRKDVRWLEASLRSFRGGRALSEADVRDVVLALHRCCASPGFEGSGRRSRTVAKIAGCVRFCGLLLKLDDDSIDAGRHHAEREREMDASGKHPEAGCLVTKDVLLASILHYSECFDARYDGVYDEGCDGVCEGVQHALAVESAGDETSAVQKPGPRLLPSAASGNGDNNSDNNGNGDNATERDPPASGTGGEPAIVLVGDREGENGATPAPMRLFDDPGPADASLGGVFSEESLRLAGAASKLKRIEILSSLTLASPPSGPRKRPLGADEYASVRNLMLSLTDDWRALAIRCAASLFRLEGILEHSEIHSGRGGFRRKSPEVVLAAKDSLKIYAGLAQQMGLHRLHTQLESGAFRILYPRQYSASSSLFREHGAAMEVLSGFLSNQLEQLLCEDLSLMFELESLEVASRVKEPYSFWKKLLRTRIRPILASASGSDSASDSNPGSDSKNKGVERTGDGDGGTVSVATTQEGKPRQRQMVRSTDGLSIVEVNDGVALRVVLKARKLDPCESDETTRERERMLCYYVHHLVRSRWPETDVGRVKDYIRNPKPNGYQSLHHTSRITRNHQDFFFEVQVRSQEMHELAEFGVAAHSSYKLTGNSNSNASGSASSLPKAAMLPPAGDPDGPGRSSSSSSALVVSPRGQPSTPEPAAGGSRALPVAADAGTPGPYIHALQETRRGLVQNHVYVFLAGAPLSASNETGRLLGLPAGSLVKDVLGDLRTVRGGFGAGEEASALRVWRNGRPARLGEAIENGDVIVVEPLLPPLPGSDRAREPPRAARPVP